MKQILFVCTLTLLVSGLTACNPGGTLDCLDGCSSGQGPRGVQGVPSTVVPLTPDENSINEVVLEENQYRDLLGQDPLTQGLNCTLYTTNVGATSIATATLTSKATYGYHGVFDQPNASAGQGVNFLPPQLQSQYTQWYVIRCSGNLVVTDSNYYEFDMNSDDGSVLYLDGVALINNDGNHGQTVMSGSKLLKRGVHTFRLDYMQGPSGSEAMQLSSGGAHVPAENFYR